MTIFCTNAAKSGQLNTSGNGCSVNAGTQYQDDLEAARTQCDADITMLPAVIELKLAYYDACFDIALQHGDRHGANNWAQSRQMLQALRDHRAAHDIHATTEGRCHDHA